MRTHAFDDPSKPAHEPIELTLETVDEIHHDGGTVLGAGRGGINIGAADGFVEAEAWIRKHEVSALFVVGGDGTQTAACGLDLHLRGVGVKCAVVGIPKTIDNDCGIIDRSFGFETAVEEAVRAVHSATVEARSAGPRGASARCT